MHSPLTMVKVHALYHFYGMMILTGKRLTKGDFKSAVNKPRDYMLSFHLALLRFPSLHQHVLFFTLFSPCQLTVFHG